jgi:hypothetical protein
MRIGAIQPNVITMTPNDANSELGITEYYYLGMHFNRARYAGELKDSVRLLTSQLISLLTPFEPQPSK